MAAAQLVAETEAATSAAVQAPAVPAAGDSIDVDTHVVVDKASKRKAEDDSVPESSKKARVEEPAKLKRCLIFSQRGRSHDLTSS